MKVVAIIPARMGSSRFPGKPLASLCGIPMVEHVFRRAMMSKLLDEVWVATCDQVIMDAVEAAGGRAVMTSDSHERCTDRVAEAMLKIAPDSDIVVNIQGDEPLLHPDMVDLAVKPLLEEPDLQVVHLVARINNDEDFDDPNEVKVVFDPRWKTLYCSREPIPSRRKGGKDYDRWKQVCVIPFRRDFLLKFNQLPQTPLEKIESVDMMRAVEHGYDVRCVVSEFETLSVDTPEDLALASLVMAKNPLFAKYRP